MTSRPLVLLVLATACLLPAAARAGLAPTGTMVILRDSRSPDELRARLLDFARTHETSDRLAAGEAWYYRGQSFARAARPDSAIECWRRAVALRGGQEDRMELAEAWLDRNAPGDAERALGLIEPALDEARSTADPSLTRLQAIAAWGEYLTGATDRARDLFEPIEPQLVRSRRWSVRCARAYVTGPNARGALQLLQSAAVVSRGEDTLVVRLMENAAEQAGLVTAMRRMITDLLDQRDGVERQAIERLGGRRIRFAGSDGFPLSGVALIPGSKARARACVVMMAPGDTVADYDSLTAVLRSSGLAVLLLDARGSGWAVGSTCPSPEAWRGREESLLRRSALDVRDAVRALATMGRVDTSAVVLVARGEMALAGAEAAALDRRVRALVLLSPDPDPVDRGIVPAALARRPLPTFLQQTPEDWQNNEFTELDLHAANERLSRVSDARSPGSGPEAFRHDPRVAPRFAQWLKEALAAPPPPAPPPSRPRRG